MAELFCCDEPFDAEVHRSEDGHFPARSCRDALDYLPAISGGRADRVRDDYRRIASRADELLALLRAEVSRR